MNSYSCDTHSSYHEVARRNRADFHSSEEIKGGGFRLVRYLSRYSAYRDRYPAPEYQDKVSLASEIVSDTAAASLQSCHLDPPKRS
jgi:hypothetical protein